MHDWDPKRIQARADENDFKNCWKGNFADTCTYGALSADYSTSAPRNEEGSVFLLSNNSGSVQTSYSFAAFPDAVFCVRWSSEPDEVAVAVADNHVYMMKVEIGLGKKIICCLGFHDGNILNVRYRPDEPSILASAGRDGKIALWDLRTCGNNSQLNRPISVIHDTHFPFTRERKPKRDGPTNGSVTSMEFLPLSSHLLASIGQPDYSIRFWDIRYIWKKDTRAIPREEIRAPLNGKRERAFASLCTDSVGSRVFAVSSDNSMYSYLTSNYSSTPDRSFKHPDFRTGSTYYLTCTASPDDRYLLCGSKETGAIAWPLADEAKHCYQLGSVEGASDFTTVAWSKSRGCRQSLFIGGVSSVGKIWRRTEKESGMASTHPIECQLESNTIAEPSPTWRLELPLSLRTDEPIPAWPRHKTAPCTPSYPVRKPFQAVENLNDLTLTPRRRSNLLDFFDRVSPCSKRSLILRTDGKSVDQ